MSFARDALRCVAAAAALAASPARGLQWSVYEEARLDAEAYHDGDSFHVATPRKTYVFRLYFVDAPETDDALPERVREQADYWRIDPARIPRLGEEARRFARAFLAAPFTVSTRREDARGRGHTRRYFAMVRAGDRYLSEALVANGLARVYGKGTDLPDGTDERRYWRHLERLERDARAAGLGAWARDEPASRTGAGTGAVAERDLELSRTVLVYAAGEGPPRPIGRLRRGGVVHVLGEGIPGMVRVRFKAGEIEREGQCLRADLGL